MSNILQEITVQAVQLPRHQRMALAGFLLELDDSEGTGVEQAWDEEIKSRIEAYDAGLLQADDYADIKKQMQQRFAQG